MFLHQAAAASTNGLQQKEAELGWGGTEILKRSAKNNLRKEHQAKAKAKRKATKESNRQEMQLC